MASSTSHAVVATTEEGADDESPSSSPRPPGDVFVIAEAQALIPQQPQERGSLSQRLSEGLTWEDDYYNDKEDIVAVFDMDGKIMSDYQYSIAIKCFPGGLLYSVISFLYDGDLFTVFMVLYVWILVVTFFSCKLARSAKSAKLHMAVTSDCIHIDQESPDDVHVMVRSRRLCTRHCTLES
jgi:hypothetical protein